MFTTSCSDERSVAWLTARTLHVDMSEAARTLEQIGVSRQRIIQTITLSKAFGVYGGAILGTRALRNKVIENSGLFVGNTPLPLPLANAALVAVQLLKSDASLRQRLLRAANESKAALRGVGFPVADTPSPIVAVLPRNESEVATLKKKLLAAKIHPPFIKYPGSPPNGYFRFAISSEHTREQLHNVTSVLVDFWRGRRQANYKQSVPF